MDHIENIEEIRIKWRVCPRCGKRYNEPPAISRKDNETKICSTCGNEEALIDFQMHHREDIPDLEQGIIDNHGKEIE